MYKRQKEMSFDAIDTAKGCIALFTGMLSTMQFKKDNMHASAKNGFTNATDAADYLVNHGVDVYKRQSMQTVCLYILWIR